MAATLATLGGSVYIVLAVGVFLMNAGVPVPGHAAYIAACTLAADGSLSVPLVVVAGVVPAFLGAWVGFVIGRRGGVALVERYGPRVGLTAPRREAIGRFFARHGSAAVFFARFVIVIRTFGNVFAGMSGFGRGRFLAVTAAGAVVWGVAYAALGTVFRESWRMVEERVGVTGLVIVGAIVLAAVLHTLWRRRRKRPA